MHRHLVKSALVAGAALTLLSACGTGSGERTSEARGTEAAVPAPPEKKPVKGLPGMPPVLDPEDVYAADRPGKLSPVVKDFPSRVYVPNTQSDTVTVIVWVAGLASTSDTLIALLVAMLKVRLASSPKVS